MAKVQVEPRPLSEPLAGGTSEATVAVEPLIAGRVHWPEEMMRYPGKRMGTLKALRLLLKGTDYKVPCPAFLIHHPSAGAILVDTGLHPSISTDPVQNFGRLGVRFSKPELHGGEDIPSQLRERDFDARQIPVVIMTHLHYDHASAISEFPNSTFIVSSAEWDAAASGGGAEGYRRSHYDYAFDFRTVDFDGASISSFQTFGRSFDLFGDGSIRLLFTPGHSAGHMSVLCRLEGRSFLIGGDAFYYEDQLTGDAPMPPRPADAHRFRRSLQELKLFRRQHSKAIITPGHDPDFYEGLEDRYS